MLSIRVTKVFSNNAEQYSTELWNTGSFIEASLRGIDHFSGNSGAISPGADISTPPILFAELAIDHPSGIVAISVTGAINSSALGPQAKTDNMPELIDVSIFAAIVAQHGNVFLCENFAPNTASAAAGVRGGWGDGVEDCTKGTMKQQRPLHGARTASSSKPGHGPEDARASSLGADSVQRVYSIQVAPPSLWNSSAGLVTESHPLPPDEPKGGPSWGWPVDSPRQRALGDDGFRSWAVFYALQKQGAQVELVVYTVHVDSKSGSPLTKSFESVATTPTAWSYKELALVSLAVDEPSGRLVVSFPAD